jgi:hypothetical protein
MFNLFVRSVIRSLGWRTGYLIFGIIAALLGLASAGGHR